MDPSLRALRLDCARRLLSAARDCPPAGKGVPVLLERDPLHPQSQPTLTTTAEALWALSGLDDLNEAKTTPPCTLTDLYAGLETMWARDTTERTVVRQAAWHLIGVLSFHRHGKTTVNIDSVNKIAAATDLLLTLGPDELGCWSDAKDREHEVYATWLATWALLMVVLWLRDPQQPSDDSARNTLMIATGKLELGLKFLRDLLDKEGRGLPFSTNRSGAQQEDEVQPNPAMTAYVLSLLAEAAARLPRPNLLDGTETTFDTLISQPARVWNSYREPLRRGSSESEFEHFTTCWVARALWMALFSKQHADDTRRQQWFRGIARALSGLLDDLRVKQPNCAGQFFVDIGSPRDFSFAVSDVLGLLNALHDFGPGVQSNPDHTVTRLVRIGEIEDAFASQDAWAREATEYSAFRAALATTKIDLAEQLTTLKSTSKALTKAQERLGKAHKRKEYMDQLSRDAQLTTQDVSRTTGLHASLFTTFELLAAVVGALLLMGQYLIVAAHVSTPEVSLEVSMNALIWQLIVSSACLVACAFVVGGLSWEIRRVGRRLATCSAWGIAAIGAAGAIVNLCYCLMAWNTSLPDGAGIDTADIVIGGLTVLVGAALSGAWQLHKQAAAKLAKRPSPPATETGRP